ncbi:SnoaL-like domain [Dillenia turbinata]|uniref:SnoaL-like domain n=1 Tax=Dillenia turbinata TaxID=194707 RepID=A0AAN8VMV4_9MAGN
MKLILISAGGSGRSVALPLPLKRAPSRSVSIQNLKWRLRFRRRRVECGVSASPNNERSVIQSQTETETAADVVRKFYGGINGRDLSLVEGLIAQDCVYEDLIFPHHFLGRKAILEFFGKFIDSIASELQFVIDDISDEDSSAIGVTWHLEWKGKPFPYSRGCSFYRLQVVNGKRQIIYGRDSVEPSIKPGEAALVCIFSLHQFQCVHVGHTNIRYINIFHDQQLVSVPVNQ